MTLFQKQITVLLYLVCLASGGILKNATLNYGKSQVEITGYSEVSCPATNSIFPVHLPHPTDCSKFYICDNGSAHLKICQAGLHYNPKIKTCDYPGNAGCDTGELRKPKDRLIGDDLGMCPPKNSKIPVHISHHSDCNKFYICDNGTPHLKECQLGLHFNPKIKTCDYPENAGCITGDENKIDDDEIVDDGDSCPEQNRGRPSFIPHPRDCNVFFVCQGGKKIPSTCPDDLHFNPKKGVCDFPENAECNKDVTKIMDGVPSPYCPSINGKIPIYFRHPSNCSIFYMCGNGLAYEFVCPAKLHFNLRKRLCDYESNSDCRIK